MGQSWKERKRDNFLYNMFLFDYVIAGITIVPFVLTLYLFGVLPLNETMRWILPGAFIVSLLVFIFEFNGSFKRPIDRKKDH
ncbi:hypothetical protein [Marinococcus luteus]|uniref:hypothetical protein n=1 Tax=Marinococcus luteus TaxID=1122204 RepID=UPI002ACCF7B1|nr:hypothetical protein [Marinococcus luteus]MDZ5781921.1 hypothetical protein [Marinococcus luteus]